MNIDGMTIFTGEQYAKIAMANAYGLDKENWDVRLDRGEEFFSHMEEGLAYQDTDPERFKENRSILTKADEPIMFQKAFNALMDTKNKRPSGFIMGVDATASGLQVLASVTGCEKSALAVNLINTGNREDVYTDMSNSMQEITGIKYSRGDLKKPVMTTFYNSQAVPKRLFGDLAPKFYSALEETLPGCWAAMKIMQQAQNPRAEDYRWTLPDGHTAYTRVKNVAEARINTETNKVGAPNWRFTYRQHVFAPNEFDKSLPANITHSIDGYIVREMVRRAHAQGFAVLCIHDSFWCSPNYVNRLRNNYRQIMADIADSTLFQDILREVTGSKNVQVNKLSTKLGDKIRQSDYALS